jgi:small subunit ribosomal protein S17
MNESMNETMNEQTTVAGGDAARVRTLTGRVVSNRMQKTITVSVERLVRHDKYGKYVRRTTKLLAHDEAGECQEGDVVDIAECRRLSARKAWRLVRVVKRAGEA